MRVDLSPSWQWKGIGLGSRIAQEVMEKQQQIKLLSSTLTRLCSVKYKASLIMASRMAFKNKIVAESFFHFVRLLRNHMHKNLPGQSTLASHHNMEMKL